VGGWAFKVFCDAPTLATITRGITQNLAIAGHFFHKCPLYKLLWSFILFLGSSGKKSTEIQTDGWPLFLLM